MAATRLLRMSNNPLGIGFSNELLSKPRTVTCMSKSRQISKNVPGLGRGGERKPVVVKAAGYAKSFIVISEPKIDRVAVVVDLDMALLLRNVSNLVSRWLKLIRKLRSSWRRFHVQMFIEKVIVDCRFFTMLAVAGSLLGSVLCFLEGCFLILNSYFQFFHVLSQSSEQGHVVFLLIKSIDMFLVGTAMLIFGMCLHVMFVGSSEHVNGRSCMSKNFNLEKLQKWMGIESVMEAKSKIGHAVIMILHVQVLEKFECIPMTNGLDLACFAGVMCLSSASMFVLSRIADARVEVSSSTG